MHLLALFLAFSLANATTCDVTTRGAKGDGFTDDAQSVQSVLDDPSCDEVLFPAGKTFTSGAITLKRSNVVLTIDEGAKLQGAKSGIRECDNEKDWQHWCAFLTVDGGSNITLRGNGTLEGGGKQGQHWSTLHAKSTAGIVLGDGLRIHCTNSWWCTAFFNCSEVHAYDLFIDGKTGRDGFDLVNCRNVLIEDSRIEGSDDGLCFKTQADQGLGPWKAANVVVRRCYLSSECCNAIQFGSRTEVAMKT
jgi:polygalacturonase